MVCAAHSVGAWPGGPSGRRAGNGLTDPGSIANAPAGSRANRGWTDQRAARRTTWATHLPAHAASLAAQVTRDEGLSVTVLPHSAHMSIESPDGDSALHLRVRQGSAEITLGGSMAHLFADTRTRGARGAGRRGSCAWAVRFWPTRWRNTASQRPKPRIFGRDARAVSAKPGRSPADPNRGTHPRHRVKETTMSIETSSTTAPPASASPPRSSRPMPRAPTHWERTSSSRS